MPYPQKTLGDLTTFVASGITPRGGNSTYVESGPQLIRSQNVLMGSLSLENVARINPEIFESMRRVRVLFDDVLLNITGASIGRVCRVAVDLGEAVVNQHVAIIRTHKDTLSPAFLSYAMRTDRLQQTILSGQTGAAQGGFNHQKIRALEIPLPPLPEQDRIVEILDQADALRQRRRQADALSQRILPALFNEMFGDLITNQHDLPQTPISQLSLRVTKGESPKWQGFSYQKSGILFVTSENVRMGFLDIESPKFIPIEFHKKLLRSQIQYGDLLVNLVGASIGRPCVFSEVDTQANVNQAVAVVTLDQSKIHPEFALAQIMSDAGQQSLLGNRVEGARANISLANIRDFQLLAPRLELQQKFVDAASVINAATRNQTTSAATLETLFQTLLHRAFDGSLTAKWREGLAKELLQEMKHRAR